jgi:outer membrane cobalamin receptor
METGDKARVAVLKPLDIVTRQDQGNIIAALKLYRNTKCSEDGRLFVRGGEANETQTFVDGIRVAQPTTIGNVPTRSFSPFCSADCFLNRRLFS